MARDSYSYMHLVMVAGIVLVALGLKTTIGHTGEHLHAVPAFALLRRPRHLPLRPRRLPLPPRPHGQPAAPAARDRPAGPGPGGDRGARPRSGRDRQPADLGDDRLRDPPLRRGPARGAPPPRPPRPEPRRRRGPSGCSNSCISPATAKQRAPVSVPQLAMPTLTASALDGLARRRRRRRP